MALTLYLSHMHSGRPACLSLKGGKLVLPSEGSTKNNAAQCCYILAGSGIQEPRVGKQPLERYLQHPVSHMRKAFSSHYYGDRHIRQSPFYSRCRY